MAIFRKKQAFAIIFDDNGNYLKKIEITNKHKLFSYQNKSFNILKKQSSYFTIKSFFFDKDYYFYTQSNPNPVILDKKATPIMDSEVYNIMIKTEVAKKLNDMNKFNIADYLTPKNIIIGIVAIILIYYLLQGNLI